MSNPWDERYRQEGFFYGTEPNDFLREHYAAIPSGGRVLCLAEGEGRNAVFLARLGYRVTAVDGSSVGLAKLAELASRSRVRVETVHADLNDFPIESGSWDGIVSIWCHLPPALRKRILAECALGLRPGGAIVLEHYRPEQLQYKTGGPPTAELMTTLSELEAAFTGYELRIARDEVREIREGQGHRGPSAVVQLLAVKRA